LLRKVTVPCREPDTHCCLVRTMSLLRSEGPAFLRMQIVEFQDARKVHEDKDYEPYSLLVLRGEPKANDLPEMLQPTSGTRTPTKRDMLYGNKLSHRATHGHPVMVLLRVNQCLILRTRTYTADAARMTSARYTTYFSSTPMLTPSAVM
jgi:hypothetical protein